MSATPLRPDFAVDRCLGKTVPARLRAAGWNLTLITDIFANDAQETSDEKWMTWAQARLDGAITKDANIRRSPWFSRATMPVFCLANQQLGIDEMTQLFLAHAERIARIALAHPGRQFWTIYSDTRMDDRTP